jgi:hypothetical protein
MGLLSWLPIVPNGRSFDMPPRRRANGGPQLARQVLAVAADGPRVMTRHQATVAALLSVCCAGGPRHNELGSPPGPPPTLSVSASQLGSLDIDDISPVRRETRELQPCVYTGSLTLYRNRARRAQATVVDDDRQQLVRFWAAEVAELRLPSRARESFPIRLSWPVAVSGKLAAGHLPLELRTRVDVLPPHLFLPPGARVYGWSTAAGQAHVARQRSPGMAYEVGVAVDRELPCSALALAGSAAPAAPGRLDMASRVLFSAPQSKRIGVIETIGPTPLVEVLEVVERDSKWAHVRGYGSHTTFVDERYAAWDFDAWIMDEPSEPDEPAEGPPPPKVKLGPPSHQTTRELAAYIDRGARPVGTIPSGVPLRAEPPQAGFVRVRLPGVESALYVSEADLRGGAREVGG